MITSSPALRILLLTLAGTALGGCRVDEHSNNGHDDVGIRTPMGGFSVKTDEHAVQQGLGLSVYPGAVLIKKEKGKDDSADVNLSIGNFHLGVKALSYQTPDAETKVIAFYRKDMARYGAVIECRDKQPVGTPVRTQDGLTCADQNDNHVHVNTDSDDPADHELRAGSRRRQHIVGLEPRDGGTKIGLVALDLPDTDSLKHHDRSEDDDKQ